MNKNLVQNKMYNYFDIGDAKTLVKLKEKYSTLFYKYKRLDFGIKCKNKTRLAISQNMRTRCLD